MMEHNNIQELLSAYANDELARTQREFVDLCGEGERFVCSRGGSGDHAAMKFGNRGCISSLELFPFGLRQTVPFPDGCSLLIANSFVEAKKSANLRYSA